MRSPKQFVLDKLESSRGDDLYRARASFAGLSAAKMNEQYGQSGKTRAQIVAEYEAHEAELDAAIAWVFGTGRVCE